MNTNLSYLIAISVSLIQGIRKGFFYTVVPVLLLDHDASYSQLGIY